MDVNINKIKSVLRQNVIYFKKCSFLRNEIDVEEVEATDRVKIRFEKGYNHINDNEAVFSLKCEIMAEDSSFSIEVEIIGEFELVTEEGSALIISNFEKNALAILFPYLRSQVTLLTAQPNMHPIILPTVNINNLFKKSEE